MISHPGDLAERAQSMISIANKNPYQYASRAWRLAYEKYIFGFVNNARKSLEGEGYFH